MSIVLIAFAIIGALIVGLVGGLLCRGFVYVGDKRTLDVLSAQLQAEQRIQAQTAETIRSMRSAARQASAGQRS